MAKKEDKNRIDAQWQALQPGWGQKEHDGERKMLHEALEDGENIERLLAGGWKVLERGEAMESHDGGIVVATDRRVMLLNKGRFHKYVTDISYLDILAVKRAKKAGPEAYRISSLEYNYEMRLPVGEGAPFVNFVRSRLLTEDASAEEQFSSFLDSGESVEYWTRCFIVEEIVFENFESDSQGRTKEEWWEVDEEIGWSGIAN